MANIISFHKNYVNNIIFLGDYEKDCVVLNSIFNGNIHIVPGNCDYSSKLPQEKLISIAGRKIFMAHGHQHGVKSGYKQISDAAVSVGANICLFGHTHIAANIQCNKNGILLLNPGSISEPRNNLGRSYAVIDIIGNDVLAKIVNS